MIKNFFDFGFNIDNANYHLDKWAILTNVILSSILLFFSILNFTINYNPILGSFELLIIFLSMGLIAIYKKTKKIKLFLLSTTTLLFIALLGFYFFSAKTVFSSIFLMFFPITVYLLNGLKIGTFFSIIYAVIILIDAYLGIGKFTNLVGFLNALIGLTTFTFLTFVFEYSKKEAFRNMTAAIKKLEELSYIDELTQLKNRHYMNEFILDNALLKNRPFAFCICDVDNFKKYNDFYGHKKGDEILKKIANIMDKTIAFDENSFLIRLGGEEFGAFIFDTDYKKKIEKFYSELENQSLKHIKNPPLLKCTVSMGVYFSNELLSDNFSAIYELTDNALYEAKNNGKNRVVYTY